MYNIAKKILTQLVKFRKQKIQKSVKISHSWFENPTNFFSLIQNLSHSLFLSLALSLSRTLPLALTLSGSHALALSRSRALTRWISL